MRTIDTNVLIYAFDRTDPAKHHQAVALLKSLPQGTDMPPLLWQVAIEYLAFLNRQLHKKRLTHSTVKVELDRILHSYLLALPRSEALITAIQLNRRYSLSHWDSLLLAACISAGIDTLYSEDMSHGVTYDTVTVINPFVAP